MEKFVGIVVLFCASGTGIFGAFNEGMTGDPSVLFTKSFLDFFTAGIFATALGADFTSMESVYGVIFLKNLFTLKLGGSILQENHTPYSNKEVQRLVVGMSGSKNTENWSSICPQFCTRPDHLRTTS
ncbi:DUF554 family protein, partial [Bacillus cereus]|nr:DUF554 family protein [Bacillus cereus]